MRSSSADLCHVPRQNSCQDHTLDSAAINEYVFGFDVAVHDAKLVETPQPTEIPTVRNRPQTLSVYGCALCATREQIGAWAVL